MHLLHRPTEDAAFSLDLQLDRVRQLLGVASRQDDSLAPEHWLIATGDREGSLKHPVFGAHGALSPALAVFAEDNSKRHVSKAITIWNGSAEATRGASCVSRFAMTNGRPCSVELALDSAPGVSRLGAPMQVVEFFIAACKLYRPVCAWLWNPYYVYRSVFRDRPGVGWMLYLPRPLTAAQVPEARALMPVFEDDGRQTPHQIGTVIVSVTDEPFDETNPDHARIANAIEVRLVDQDLLPRYAEL